MNHGRKNANSSCDDIVQNSVFSVGKTWMLSEDIIDHIGVYTNLVEIHATALLLYAV